MLWNFLHRDEVPPFDVELADDAAVPIQYPAGDGRAVIIDTFQGGEIAQQALHDPQPAYKSEATKGRGGPE